MPGNPYYHSAHWKALKRAAHERDGWRCTVPGCRTPLHELTADHINARPRGVPTPTPFDVLSNLRTLCGNHDRSIKERADGTRKGGGRLIVRGCDANGRPLDPNHPWNKRT